MKPLPKEKRLLLQKKLLKLREMVSALRVSNESTSVSETAKVSSAETAQGQFRQWLHKQ